VAQASLTADERRSAHLLFAEELADGTVAAADLARPEVERAVRSLQVPSALLRRWQVRQVRQGRLDMEESAGPMLAAREAVLGPRAAGPPRLLVRLDAFPAPRAGVDVARAATGALRAAGIPFLLTVVPRIPAPGAEGGRRRHDAAEADLLEDLRRDPGVTFGVGGLDGRPLDGLDPADLEAALDEADPVLARYGMAPDILVPPEGRIDLRRYRALAERYALLCGGPGSVATMGFHRTPLWRGDAVWMPVHPPLAGPPSQVADAARALTRRQAALWLPVVLGLADLDPSGLRDVAAALTGLARPWDEFLAAARAARASADAMA
jgi:hypothetical protein